ncbi:MAG: two-component system, OmpR family, response regulator QseB [Deferribacteres bacterium]|jgi:DNA-binding response OmpR family regulator|nr:two component transcriptional regulator, winged helix family [Deferribacteraceae bacterium]MDK2792674.1 two-component system, OmpR family, response regulator QseB [Deferribacteres bacterium]
MKIAIIEDDILLAESLKEYLEELYEVKICFPFDESLYYEVKNYDIILLDLMLKDKKGENLLRTFKNKNINIPVIVITAKDDIASKEICFQNGCDDYIVKPFDPKELVLRIQALSKRVYCDDCITIDNIKINLKEKTLYKNNIEITLTKIEWELLSLLIRYRGEIVEFEKILVRVWGDKPVGTESIRTYIKNLRKILPEDSIITYKGRGYKLKA